jgi:hypothetical protein
MDTTKIDENIGNDSIDSIDGVLNTILAAFTVPNIPIAPLPPPLILLGSNLRPGLSSESILSRIISRQSEAGIVTGDVFADGPNTSEAMILIIIEEVINALLNESVVNVVIPLGIGVTTTGVGNLGAPVISLGTTTTLGIGNGIIR